MLKQILSNIILGNIKAQLNNALQILILFPNIPNNLDCKRDKNVNQYIFTWVLHGLDLGTYWI